jgi:hypothetical protein
VVSLTILRLKFDPLGKAKTPLDKLFNPAKIQSVLPLQARPSEYILLEDFMKRDLQKAPIVKSFSRLFYRLVILNQSKATKSLSPVLP